MTRPSLGVLGALVSPRRRPVALGYPWGPLLVVALAAAGVAVLALGVGSVYVPPVTAAKILAGHLPGVEVAGAWPSAWDVILWELRLPRVVLAGLVGASLSMSGASYQGLFRNPLADPYLIGVAAGAGLGATVVLVTGVPLRVGGVSLLPPAAFVGGLAAVAVAYMVARRPGGLPLAGLVLAGVAVAALAGAATSLLMLRSDPDLRPLLSWLLGGFISARWEQVLFLLPYFGLSGAVLMANARTLNLLQLEEDHARQLGIAVERVKLVLVVAATLLTAAAVSFSGLIGFVGLMAPHAVRLVWGSDYRVVMPLSAVVGAAFLIAADTVARTVVAPGELPVGVVTAFCGAPFLLYLLRRGMRRSA